MDRSLEAAAVSSIDPKDCTQP